MTTCITKYYLMVIHSSKFLASSSCRGENNALTLYSRPPSLVLVRFFCIREFASLKNRTFECEKKVVICFTWVGGDSMKQVELNVPFKIICFLFALFNYLFSYQIYVVIF